jgi:hypothetical protein
VAADNDDDDDDNAKAIEIRHAHTERRVELSSYRFAFELEKKKKQHVKNIFTKWGGPIGGWLRVSESEVAHRRGGIWDAIEGASGHRANLASISTAQKRKMCARQERDNTRDHTVSRKP